MERLGDFLPQSVCVALCVCEGAEQHGGSHRSQGGTSFIGYSVLLCVSVWGLNDKLGGPRRSRVGLPVSVHLCVCLVVCLWGLNDDQLVGEAYNPVWVFLAQPVCLIPCVSVRNSSGDGHISLRTFCCQENKRRSGVYSCGCMAAYLPLCHVKALQDFWLRDKVQVS